MKNIVPESQQVYLLNSRNYCCVCYWFCCRFWIKRNILNLYRADISEYAACYEQKVTRVFDTIPSQLQRHEKRFLVSDLEKGARTRNYANVFFWLEESRVINVCFAATEPNVGLNLSRVDAKLKIYMAETGLLIAMAFDEKDIRQEQLYKKLMFDKLEINNGSPWPPLSRCGCSCPAIHQPAYVFGHATHEGEHLQWCII